jgi:hypothetical protein
VSTATKNILKTFDQYIKPIIGYGNNFEANTHFGDRSRLPCLLKECGGEETLSEYSGQSETARTYVFTAIHEASDLPFYYSIFNQPCPNGFYRDNTAEKKCSLPCPSSKTCSPFNKEKILPDAKIMPDDPDYEGFQNFSKTYNSGQSYSWAYLLLLFTVIWQSILIFSRKPFIKKRGGPMIISVLIILFGLYQFIDRR